MEILKSVENDLMSRELKAACPSTFSDVFSGGNVSNAECPEEKAKTNVQSALEKENASLIFTSAFLTPISHSVMIDRSLQSKASSHLKCNRKILIRCFIISNVSTQTHILY